GSPGSVTPDTAQYLHTHTPRLWVSGSSRRCGGFQRLSPETEAGVRISGCFVSIRDTMTWLSAALLALAP
ncbi:hypothetical protein KIL84_010275, partial [Mauremys mutica]